MEAELARFTPTHWTKPDNLFFSGTENLRGVFQQ
jgi:hypothetical protein